MPHSPFISSYPLSILPTPYSVLVLYYTCSAIHSHYPIHTVFSSIPHPPLSTLCSYTLFYILYFLHFMDHSPRTTLQLPFFSLYTVSILHPSFYMLYPQCLTLHSLCFPLHCPFFVLLPHILISIPNEPFARLSPIFHSL